jgi:hypothetical protein
VNSPRRVTRAIAYGHADPFGDPNEQAHPIVSSAPTTDHLSRFGVFL